ncbi:LysE family translocator [Roseitalea porphyridii]|uniref:LysE family translocator n=1 Tax=Roseitalea porphyridii TaxID=1852022 RepID=A0A4P6V302_9HYPH|nr:LysE family translocator [Roseitalea porphyridii]QBK30830.1 LysE family translocator [Roseitalea porphyridii]
MVDPATLLAYLIACIVIVIVPGPSVTVIIANSLRTGTSAGLANVAGTQAGLLIMIGVLALGLETVVTVMGEMFVWLKLAGAAYLIWLGVKMWRSDGRLGEPDAGQVRARSLRGYFWQGFIVIWSNPKALFFFGAFIPQFIVPEGNAALQTVFLGLIFMITATVLDSGYALAAGKTGGLLSRHNVRILERVSGTFLIGGGVWLALSKRAQ